MIYFLRLSIIDLNNRSNQPFIKFNKILLFNGEIYNYLELKNELKKKYSFSTKSDTEVLLTAYQEYGENFCERLEGMWSFVIVDKEKNSFCLVMTDLARSLCIIIKIKNLLYLLQN